MTEQRGRARTGLAHACLLLVASSLVRSLDGGGLLPGVHESAKIRAAVADPRILLLWVPIAAIAGLASAATRGRTRPGRLSSVLVPWALTAVAFPAMFGVSEASAHAGAPLHWEELGWPVLLQVALAGFLIVVGWSLRRGFELVGVGGNPIVESEPLGALSRSEASDRRPLATRERGPPWRVTQLNSHPTKELFVNKTVTVALMLPLVVGSLAACSDKKKTATPVASPSASAASTTSCEGKLTKDPALALPSGFPTELTLILTSMQKAGATSIYFGALPETDISGARDDLAAKLVAGGYKIVGKDQEPGTEAEAQFTGPHNGTLRTRFLCTDYLEVRYSFDN